MSPAVAQGIYRRRLQEPVTIRRFTGPAGPNRTATDYPARGHVKQHRAGSPEALVGDVMQQIAHALISVEDLTAAGFGAPITTGDKLVVAGRELAISLVDVWTHNIGGALRAYRLTVKG
jgi:hypothetical protein